MSTSNPTGLFTDHTGSTSAGRVIGLIVVCIGSITVISGVVLAFLEALKVTSTGFGIIIVGSGVGIITTALGYLGYHKTQESKVEMNQSNGDSENGR